jgi:hypothetical protein
MGTTSFNNGIVYAPYIPLYVTNTIRGATVCIRRTSERLDSHVIYENFEKRYYQNGFLHRIDGPARVNDAGEYWYYEGWKHRLDGPAVIKSQAFDYTQLKHYEGRETVVYLDKVQYWIHGTRYERSAYLEQLKVLKVLQQGSEETGFDL